jgi:hypothetical protein
MATATLERKKSAAKTTRTTAKLTLEINGVAYDVIPFGLRDDPEFPEGQSRNGFEHRLRSRDGGGWFQVFDRDGEDFGTVFYCERCRAEGCHHAVALEQVGLMG